MIKVKEEMASLERPYPAFRKHGSKLTYGIVATPNL